MNEPSRFNSIVGFLWAIADLLNGSFKKSEFQKIILPFTVLRRLDYALEGTKAKVSVLFQTIEGLHNACPDNKGDWYFSGNYPTPGGNKVVNKAFINYMEGRTARAY
jgi:type I restriction-modification system DNA methylase subunit